MSLPFQAIGDRVADDFIFSYDGITVLLSEAAACRKNNRESFNACVMKRMRNESWRSGASGTFRFLANGSTERPMIFKKITKTGFADL